MCIRDSLNAFLKQIINIQGFISSPFYIATIPFEVFNQALYRTEAGNINKTCVFILLIDLFIIQKLYKMFYFIHFSQIPLAVPFTIFNICILPIQACSPNTTTGTIKTPSTPKFLQQ